MSRIIDLNLYKFIEGKGSSIFKNSPIPEELKENYKVSCICDEDENKNDIIAYIYSNKYNIEDCIVSFYNSKEKRIVFMKRIYSVGEAMIFINSMQNSNIDINNIKM